MRICAFLLFACWPLALFALAATQPAPSSRKPSVTNQASSAPGKTNLAGALKVSGKPTMCFIREWEKNERAFSLLVPEGWKMEGGIFNVNPMQAGGPGNSLAPKCDLTLSKDDAKSVFFRFVPTWSYADLSLLAGMMPAAGMFPPGANYNGCVVKPIMSAQAFLENLFRTTHPAAIHVQTIAIDPMREIVAGYVKGEAQLNQQLQMLGIAPFRYDAAALMVEYEESGRRYREILFTAIRDGRGAGMWSNEWTMIARAPAAEAGQWKPVLDTIRISVRFNTQWLAAVMRNADERAKIIQETQQYIAKLDREIFENRSKTRSQVQNENYLLITGQEEYVNPYTKEVEVDTSYYQRRWTTSDGRYLYTDDILLDPNKVDGLNKIEWKQTKARPR